MKKILKLHRESYKFGFLVYILRISTGRLISVFGGFILLFCLFGLSYQNLSLGQTIILGINICVFGVALIHNELNSFKKIIQYILFSISTINIYLLVVVVRSIWSTFDIENFFYLMMGLSLFTIIAIKFSTEKD